MHGHRADIPIARPIDYGDSTPVTLLARHAAVAEGVTGQFYLAILVW